MKIADMVWESRYSYTSADDKFGRWMRIGRINNMTVAIITKVKMGERFLVKLPNCRGDESIENCLILHTEEEAKKEAVKYIRKYVSNFIKNEVVKVCKTKKN